MCPCKYFCILFFTCKLLKFARRCRNLIKNALVGPALWDFTKEDSTVENFADTVVLSCLASLLESLFHKARNIHSNNMLTTTYVNRCIKMEIACSMLLHMK